jgi:predicted RNase H-like HicB family nuclease
MKLWVTLERDETDAIVAECPTIPGCVSQGQTEEEALMNIKEAILACLEVRAEQGLPLTVRTVEVDVAVA